MSSPTFPTDVRVFIDDDDVTYLLFGTETINPTEVTNKFQNLDITTLVKYVGDHTLKITAGAGVGRVDARITLKSGGPEDATPR